MSEFDPDLRSHPRTLPSHMPKSTQFERFEQAIVFRGARILPLTLSAIATVLVVLSILALGYSFVPTSGPERSADPPLPAPVTLTLADIQAFQSQSDAANASQASSRSTAAAAAVDPDAKMIAAAIDSFRVTAESKGLAWTDRYETVCTERMYGYCIDTDRRLVKTGASDYIDKVLSFYDEAPTETDVGSSGVIVTFDNGHHYIVSTRNRNTKVAALNEVNAILAQSTAGKAAGVLRAWTSLRMAREQANLASWSAQREGILSKYANAQDKYQQTTARKRDVRSSAILAAAWALGVFVAVGLVLAVLAIERHTRALQAIPREPQASVQVPAVFPQA